MNRWYRDLESMRRSSRWGWRWTATPPSHSGPASVGLGRWSTMAGSIGGERADTGNGALSVWSVREWRRWAQPAEAEGRTPALQGRLRPAGTEAARLLRSQRHRRRCADEAERWTRPRCTAAANHRARRGAHSNSSSGRRRRRRGLGQLVTSGDEAATARRTLHIWSRRSATARRPRARLQHVRTLVSNPIPRLQQRVTGVVSWLRRTGEALLAWLRSLPQLMWEAFKRGCRAAGLELLACLRQPSRIVTHARNARRAVSEFVHHFWEGCKLLSADARVSWKILRRVFEGKQLTRRERNILIGTGSDLARLVPFSFFIIVPFMEFALPIALRLFPNMIPSQFQDKKKKEEDLKRQLKARLELAKYLQDVVEDKARTIKARESVDKATRAEAEQLTEFLRDLRAGKPVKSTDLQRFARLFNDEFTMESTTRDQLVAMCKYMGIAAHGNENFLRYRLRARLASIKNDDMQISWEGGVASLTDDEVAQACRDRGIRTDGLNVAQQRQQLAEWLELSQNREVPGSLMILSRALFYTKDPEAALKETLSALPEGLVQDVRSTREAEASEAEAAQERGRETARRLAEVRRQERLLELEQERERAETVQDDVEEAERAATDAAREMPSSAAAAAAATTNTTTTAAERTPVTPDAVVQRHLREMNAANRKEAVASISVALEDMLNPVVAKERTELEQLKQELAQEVAQQGEQPPSPEIIRLRSLVQRLEAECELVEQKVGDALQLLDRDNDGFISVKEITDAIAELRLGKPITPELHTGESTAAAAADADRQAVRQPESVVAEVLRRLDLDADGIIRPEDVRRLAAQVAAERRSRAVPRNSPEDEKRVARGDSSEQQQQQSTAAAAASSSSSSSASASA